MTKNKETTNGDIITSNYFQTLEIMEKTLSDKNEPLYWLVHQVRTFSGTRSRPIEAQLPE